MSICRVAYLTLFRTLHTLYTHSYLDIFSRRAATRPSMKHGPPHKAKRSDLKDNGIHWRLFWKQQQSRWERLLWHFLISIFSHFFSYFIYTRYIWHGDLILEFFFNDRTFFLCATQLLLYSMDLSKSDLFICLLHFQSHKRVLQQYRLSIGIYDETWQPFLK